MGSSMAKLNDKQKILAIAGGGLAICLAAGAGIWWANGLVEQEQAQIAKKSEEIDAAQAKIAKIPSLVRSVIILRENVDAYTRILPDQSEVNNFLRTTNQFAFQSGVILNDFLKGSTGKRGKYNHYSYRMELQATVWQFLKFINLYENMDRFVRVVSFSIKSADPKEAEKALQAGEDAVHKMSIVVETYVYNGKNDSSGIEIKNYKSMRDSLREEISKSAQALQLERYEISDKVGRRDIFLDPRPTIGGTNVSDNSQALQRRRVEDFIAKVVEVRQLQELWRERDQSYVTRAKRETDFRDQLEELDAQADVMTPRITNQSLQARWNKDVLVPIADMWRSLGPDVAAGGGEPGEGARGMDADKVRALIAAMRNDVERGDFDEAIARHNEFSDRLVFDAEDERYPLAARAMKLRLMIEAVVEFQEIPMDIAGVVVFEEGRSGLLVNGTVYEEGEYLEDDLLLKGVESESAEFVYKGFNLRKRW